MLVENLGGPAAVDGCFLQITYSFSSTHKQISQAILQMGRTIDLQARGSALQLGRCGWEKLQGTEKGDSRPHHPVSHYAE